LLVACNFLMAQAIVSFLAIIDPVGNVLVFHLFAQRLPFQQRALAAVVAVAAAFVMLLAFSLGGNEVLDFLGISPESFQVAAGLLLLPPAYRLVAEGQPAPVPDDESPDGPFDFALVPLATPLIAGPGALAATTALSQSAGRDTTIAAFTIVLLITLVSFVAADLIFRLAGPPLLRVLSRIVGILLFAIAVDFILDGVRDFVEATAFVAPLLGRQYWT
jgi:multiple antibiotic resistance protein